MKGEDEEEEGEEQTNSKAVILYNLSSGARLCPSTGVTPCSESLITSSSSLHSIFLLLLLLFFSTFCVDEPRQSLSRLVI